MEIYLAGTGTSHGIPVIGCNCRVCRSMNKKDKRMRSSAFIKASDGTSVVIDTGPDFRMQVLKKKLTRIDAVLITHSHADHLHGIDDLRIFSHTPHGCKPHAEISAPNERPVLCLYSNRHTLNDIEKRFSYIFSKKPNESDKPAIKLINVETFSEKKPLRIGCLSIVPVPLMHGSLQTCGWKCTDTLSGKPNSTFAYISDCSFICEESLRIIDGSEHLVIDALRERPHPTHLNFSQSIELAQKCGAKNVWFTHICHEHSHKDISRSIKRSIRKTALTGKHIAPAFDGLTLYC